MSRLFNFKISLLDESITVASVPHTVTTLADTLIVNGVPSVIAAIPNGLVWRTAHTNAFIFVRIAPKMADSTNTGHVVGNRLGCTKRIVDSIRYRPVAITGVFARRKKTKRPSLNAGSNKNQSKSSKNPHVAYPYQDRCECQGRIIPVCLCVTRKQTTMILFGCKAKMSDQFLNRFSCIP